MKENENDEFRHLMQPPKFDAMNLIAGVAAVGLWVLGIIKLFEIIF